jgi:ubiquinone biosynthesis protein UbiJ
MEEIKNTKPRNKEVKDLFKKIKNINKQIAELPNRLNTLNGNIKIASEFVIEDIVKKTLK